jgi:hypothetical protein
MAFGGVRSHFKAWSTRASLPFYQPGIVLKEAAAPEDVIVEIEPSIKPQLRSST